MKHKRFLAILLALVMLFGMIPSNVFAATPPVEEPILVPVVSTEAGV